MKHNQIKIVSSNGEKSLSYFFQNEKAEWNLVSNFSELSRKKYTAASIKENASKILQVINDTYNIGNRGVDVYFEGSKEDFTILRLVAEKHFPDCIYCYHQRTSIAVAGKIGVGKTILIEELAAKQGWKLDTLSSQNITEYDAIESNVAWYEIPGIDLGKENVLTAMQNFDVLAKNGVTNFVYCLNTNKIEGLEEQFIGHVKEKYPGINILVVLTMCLEDDNAEVIANQLMQTVGTIKVISTLARDYKTREGMVPAYGLDEIIKYLFEGKG